MMKQILTKYPACKSQMLDTDDDMCTALQDASIIYRVDLGDPQLSNASQTTIIPEMIHTYL